MPYPFEVTKRKDPLKDLIIDIDNLESLNQIIATRG